MPSPDSLSGSHVVLRLEGHERHLAQFFEFVHAFFVPILVSKVEFSLVLQDMHWMMRKSKKDPLHLRILSSQHSLVNNGMCFIFVWTWPDWLQTKHVFLLCDKNCIQETANGRTAAQSCWQSLVINMSPQYIHTHIYICIYIYIYT